MDDEYPPAYIKEYQEVFDRFTFDDLFKRLLADGYDNEDAKNAILYNCALSLLVIQERIDNGYYLKIKVNSGVAPDLVDLYLEEKKRRRFCNEN